jgi:hypothetical protein
MSIQRTYFMNKKGGQLNERMLEATRNITAAIHVSTCQLVPEKEIKFVLSLYVCVKAVALLQQK